MLSDFQHPELHLAAPGAEFVSVLCLRWGRPAAGRAEAGTGVAVGDGCGAAGLQHVGALLAASWASVARRLLPLIAQALPRGPAAAVACGAGAQ